MAVRKIIELSDKNKELMEEEIKHLEEEKRFFETELNSETISMYLYNPEIAKVLKTAYGEMIRIMGRFYDNLQSLSNYRYEELGKEEAFVRFIIERQLMLGVVISSEEFEQFKKDIKDGKYNEQMEVFQKLFQKPGKIETDQDELKEPLKKDIKKILERFGALNFYLESVYGKEDYQKAFFIESVFNLPSLESALFKRKIVQEQNQRDAAYVDDISKYLASFDPKKRVENLVKIAKEIGIENAWYHPKIERLQIDDFDRGFIESLADEMGKTSLDGLYEIFQHNTRLRREKFFRIESKNPGEIFKALFGESSSAEERETLLKPVKIEKISFDELGGYEEKKSFFGKLLKHISARDRVLDELNIVLLSGPPGVGKSMSVISFLNGLPENARGIFLEIRKFYEELDYLRQLAKAHPDLYLIGIAEDLDTIAGSRDQGFVIDKFLAIDSVDTEKSLPSNVTLVFTTNREEVIDPAVIRPGRTSWVLTYEPPKEKEREEIVEIYCEKYGIEIECAKELIAKKFEKLTGDEIKQVFYYLKFEGKTEASSQDIEEKIKMVLRKRDMRDKLGYIV